MGRNVTLSMAGRGYGKAATLSRGCSARAYEAAEGRTTAPTMRTRIRNPDLVHGDVAKTPDCAGPLLSKIHPPRSRVSILAAAFRSSHVIGAGATLSRRNERRAKDRRNNKSRDCKFGSHQKCLRRVTASLQTSADDLVPARGKHCANFIFKGTSFGIAAQTSITFQTSVTFRT